MKNLLFIILILSFVSCKPETTIDSDTTVESLPTKQVEVEVYFTSGSKGVLTYDVRGELKLKDNKILDYDSSSCTCESVILANNVDAIQILKVKDLKTGNITETKPIKIKKFPENTTVEF